MTDCAHCCGEHCWIVKGHGSRQSYIQDNLNLTEDALVRKKIDVTGEFNFNIINTVVFISLLTLSEKKY